LIINSPQELYWGLYILNSRAGEGRGGEEGKGEGERENGFPVFNILLKEV